MTKKIEELTPAQEARMEEYYQEWLKIGLCTDPADKPRAEAAITEIYKLVEASPPRFIWEPSPLACQIRMGKDFGDKPTGDLPYEYRHTYFCGQLDAYWVAFYLFGEELGVEYDEASRRELHLFAEIVRSCGWWWPFEGVCYVADRPEICAFDDQDRPHSDNGPAWRFRDGWEDYAISGVWVPKNVVLEPEKQTIQDIRAEQNEEVRRVRIERFAGQGTRAADGWIRFLREAEARLIDERKNEVEDTLEKLFKIGGRGSKDPEGCVLLGSCPSTARMYAMEVATEIKTCAEASAWLKSGNALTDELGEGRIIGAS